MGASKFSEDVQPLTELKTRASALINQVNRSRRPVLLTRRGRGVAVLMDLEEYERLVQRADFIDAVEEGARASMAGDLHPHSEAAEILSRYGSSDG
mgnify:CR=1 FL=1